MTSSFAGVLHHVESGHRRELAAASRGGCFSGSRNHLASCDQQTGARHRESLAGRETLGCQCGLEAHAAGEAATSVFTLPPVRPPRCALRHSHLHRRWNVTASAGVPPRRGVACHSYRARRIQEVPPLLQGAAQVHGPNLSGGQAASRRAPVAPGPSVEGWLIT